jgi:hypothetical protein
MENILTKLGMSIWSPSSWCPKTFNMSSLGAIDPEKTPPQKYLGFQSKLED